MTLGGRLRPYGWMLGIGLLVHAQTVSFGLTYLDDVGLFQHRPSGAIGMVDRFLRNEFDTSFSGATAHYRPILGPLYTWARSVGMALWVYHLANVLLHLVAASLLLLLLQRLAYGPERAWWAALLFVVHPAVAQSVAWIPGSVDLVLAIFVLAALIALDHFLASSRWSSYLAHLVFVLGALLTKETAVALPVVAFCFLLIRQEAFGSPKTWRLIAGWLGIGILWGLLRYGALGAVVSYQASDILRWIWANVPTLIPYLGKTVLPCQLAAWQLLRDARMIDGLVTFVLLVALVGRSRQARVRYILFGVLWFVLFLLPTFIRPAEAGIYLSEQRMYIPLIGILFVLLELDAVKALSRYPKRVALAAGLGVMLLSPLTIWHARHFANGLKFWEHAVATSPHSPFNRVNLGLMYFLNGRLEEAEATYRQALALNPRERVAYNNLGNVYVRQGRWAEAEQAYQQEMTAHPESPRAYVNLGNLYLRQDRLDEAARLWIKALQLTPDHLQAHQNLAAYYVQRQQFERAAFHAEELRKRGVPVPVDISRALQAHAQPTGTTTP